MELIPVEQDIDLNKTITVKLSLREMVMLTAALAKTRPLDRGNKYNCWGLNIKDIEDSENDSATTYEEMKEILKQNGIN